MPRHWPGACSWSRWLSQSAYSQVRAGGCITLVGRHNMAINTNEARTLPALSSTSPLSKQMRNILTIGTITLFTTLLALVYLMPFGYAAAVSLRGTSIETDTPLWPAKSAQYTYEGQPYDLYKVTIDGQTRQLALVKKGREQST